MREEEEERLKNFLGTSSLSLLLLLGSFSLRLLLFLRFFSPFPSVAVAVKLCFLTEALQVSGKDTKTHTKHYAGL